MQVVGVVAGATSATLPAHAAGDYIVGFAVSDTSLGAASPGGWNLISNGQGVGSAASNMSFELSYKVASGSDTVTGTWANTSLCVFIVLRGASGLFANGISSFDDNTTDVSYDIPTVEHEFTVSLYVADDTVTDFSAQIPAGHTLAAIAVEAGYRYVVAYKINSAIGSAISYYDTAGSAGVRFSNMFSAQAKATFGKKRRDRAKKILLAKRLARLREMKLDDATIQAIIAKMEAE